MKKFVVLFVSIVVVFASCSTRSRRVDRDSNYIAKVVIIPDGNVTFISNDALKFFKKGDTIPVFVMLKAPKHNLNIGKWGFNARPLFSGDTIIDQKYPEGIFTYRSTKAKIDSIFTRNGLKNIK